MWRVELLASMTVLVAVITRVALDRESGGIHLLKQQFWGEESTHRMKMYPPAGHDSYLLLWIFLQLAGYT